MTYLQFTSQATDCKLAVREDRVFYYAFSEHSCNVYFEDETMNFTVPRPCRVSRIEGVVPQEPGGAA